MADVVTVFLRNRAELLLIRRSDAVGTYTGRWAGISGYLEGDSADAVSDARRELREEVNVTDARLVRAGEPLEVTDEGHEWTVHPFLFACDHREVNPNWELETVDWVPATTILDRETVPCLWATYRRVAPSVETIANDTEHGSAYVSLRALEVLRDEAAVLDSVDELAETARTLRAARPSMAAVRNRVNRVMSRSSDRTEQVLEAAIEIIAAVQDADTMAAATAAEVVGEYDGAILTISRSGTVRAALDTIDTPTVIAASRPGGEGITVADDLAAAGHDVTVIPDAAVAYAVTSSELDIVAALVGADTVDPDGRVLNKVGTLGCALACAAANIPCYVVTAADKISHRTDLALEFDSSNGLAPTAWRPLFDVTPGELVEGYITEEGLLDRDGLADQAAERARWATWDADEQ